jgi:hypothetical protein
MGAEGRGISTSLTLSGRLRPAADRVHRHSNASKSTVTCEPCAGAAERTQPASYRTRIGRRVRPIEHDAPHRRSVPGWLGQVVAG